MSIQDLANFHYPVSDLFQRAASELDFEPFRLSKEQIESFHELGYVADIKIFDEHEDFLK